MNIQIHRMILKHFKGIKEKTIEFGEKSTDIRGRNGEGKTSLADGFYFVFCNCDSRMTYNPPVTPLGENECETFVEIECMIDGKPTRISRNLKYTKKEDLNADRVTVKTTSTYAINDVPKSFKDFTQYFTDLGIDLDKFLILSHPDAFTKDNSAKGRDAMRKALFEMASDKSDLDIAKEMSGIAELTIELGRGYGLDEIKAMNAATIKKIETENGKRNELIESRIQGMIESKTDVNIAGLVEREMDIKEQIKQTESEIAELNSGNTKVRIMELENKLREVEAKVKDDFYKERQEHIDKHNSIIDKYRDVETVINTANKVIFENEKGIENCNTLLESLRIDYDSVFNKQYDGSSTCPVCKQELPKLMLADAKANFEADKARNLSSIQSAAARVHRDIDDKEKLIADAKETISRVTPSLEMLKGQLEEWEKVSITEPRLEDTPEAVSLQAEINALKAETTNSSDMKLQGLNEYLESLKNDLRSIDGDYKSIENNKAIDEKIAALRDKRLADETTKAKAEKILFEITEFEKFKNNLLTKEINSHFELVDWRLYEYQKNGEYKPCCYPTYEGKQIDVDTNTALSVAMRLDIATSLQKFNDFYVPIFIDKAESLDSQTRRDIASHKDAQIIWLTVNDEELTIVKGE